MLEKLFGLIKAKECVSKIKALRDDYEFKIAELRKSIDEVEKHRDTLRKNNTRLSEININLHIELINKDKEIRNLQKAIKKLTGERFDMAMSLRGMFGGER